MTDKPKTIEERAQNYTNIVSRHARLTPTEKESLTTGYIQGATDQEALHGWINVKERLPREKQEVLVNITLYGEKPRIVVGMFFKATHGHPKDDWVFVYHRVDGSADLDSSEATHWQPLPSPPKQ